MAHAQEARNLLANWRKGPIAAEEMVGAILKDLLGYTHVEPINQQGGPDDNRDLRCRRNGTRYVCGCYFPPTALQIAPSELKTKFLGDLKGVKKDKAKGFIFATNVVISEQSRKALRVVAKSKGCNRVEFLTIDELCMHLNGKPGVGLREVHLGIQMSVAEGVSAMADIAKEQKDFLLTVLQQASKSKNRPRGKRGPSRRGKTP